MGSNALRLWLIGLLAVAAVVSVVGNKTHSPFIGWLSFAVFLTALCFYATWRRKVLNERREKRRLEADEARARPDQ